MDQSATWGGFRRDLPELMPPPDFLREKVSMETWRVFTRTVWMRNPKNRPRKKIGLTATSSLSLSLILSEGQQKKGS